MDDEAVARRERTAPEADDRIWAIRRLPRIGRVFAIPPLGTSPAGLAASIAGPGLVTGLALLAGLEGKQGPGILYLLAVLVATYAGGLWAGILAAGLAFVGYWYFFLPPAHSFAGDRGGEAILAGVLFLLSALVVAQLLERQRLSRSRAEKVVEALGRSEELLRIRARQQLEVAELGRLALGGARVQTLLSRAVKVVVETLGADRAVALELLPDRDELRLRASHGLGDDRESTTIPVERSLAGLTLASETPLVIGDLRAVAGLVLSPIEIESGATSAAAFKVRGTEHPWGVLIALARLPDRFTDDDASFLRTVANALASAIGRRRVEDAVRESAARLRLALEAGQLATWDWDVEAGDMRWSDNLEEALGLPPGSFGGNVQAFLHLVHTDDRERVRAAIDAVLAGDEDYDLEFRFVRPDRSVGWMSTQGYVARDDDGRPLRMIGLARDVTARKRREESLAFLAESGEILSSTLDYGRTLAEVARLAVPRLADCCIVDVAGESREARQVAVVHVDPKKEELVRELERRYPPGPSGEESFLGRALRELRPRLVERVTEPFLLEVARDAEHLQALRQLDLVSALFTPLVARGRWLGAITLLSGESGERFGPDDLALATDLARHAALAVDNARLYRQRSHVAMTLQRSLLPPALPHVSGVELDARYRPVGEGLEVGGDFYDAFAIDSRSVGIVIGDVCGKGPEAAAVTGLTRHTIRAASLHERSPARTLAALNDAILKEYEGSTFCTVAFGLLTPRRGGAGFQFACGGHPLPLLLQANGRVAPVGRHGTLVGAFSDPELDDTEIELVAGDALVLYTDGLPEAFAGGLEDGERRLSELLSGCAGLSAEAIAARIEEAITEAGRAADRDDIAFLVVRIGA